MYLFKINYLCKIINFKSYKNSSLLKTHENKQLGGNPQNFNKINSNFLKKRFLCSLILCSKYVYIIQISNDMHLIITKIFKACFFIQAFGNRIGFMHL